jgi:hypothetical protein
MASEAGLGRGLFVPEGQLRVARHEVPGSDAESSVLEGWPKSLSVPEIFVLETESRHERATARRMLVPLGNARYPC